MKGLTKVVTVTAMLGMLGACSGMKEIEIRDTKAHPTWYEDCEQIGSEGWLFWKTDFAYSCGMGESKFEQASESQDTLKPVHFFQLQILTVCPI